MESRRRAGSVSDSVYALSQYGTDEAWLIVEKVYLS